MRRRQAAGRRLPRRSRHRVLATNSFGQPGAQATANAETVNGAMAQAVSTAEAVDGSQYFLATSTAKTSFAGVTTTATAHIAK